MPLSVDLSMKMIYKGLKKNRKEKARKYYKTNKFFIQLSNESYKKIERIAQEFNNPIILDAGGLGEWLKNLGVIHGVDFRLGDDVDNLSEIIQKKNLQNIDLAVYHMMFHEPVDWKQSLTITSQYQKIGSKIYIKTITPLGKSVDKYDITQLNESIGKQYFVDRPDEEEIIKHLEKIGYKTKLKIMIEPGKTIPYEAVKESIEKARQNPRFEKLMNIIRKLTKIAKDPLNKEFGENAVPFFNGKRKVLKNPGRIAEIIATKSE